MAENTPGMDTGNEINGWGKFFAGLTLILLTSGAIFLVIAYWPNKMPDVKDGDDGAWYTNKAFNVILIEKGDPATAKYRDSIGGVVDSIKAGIASFQKNSALTKSDSATLLTLTDSLDKVNQHGHSREANAGLENKNRVHLNTILLLLVALMGFLGNMVHIATSFTTFVGNETFKKSWILWYFVKPFTAAGLAVIIYFIIRAGFLSYGSGAGSVSLYGILSLAAFAGLFTDSATLKLKEVFEVIFRPKDDRKDKLDGEDDVSIATVSPETIPPATESTLVLTGKNLNKPGLTVTFDGTAVVTLSAKTDKMVLKYSPSATAAAAGKAVLSVTDTNGNPPYTKDIIIK